MKRKQTTPEEWASSKVMWESDHQISFGEIGETLGISKQAVARKAKHDRWQKRMDLPKVVKLAYQAADRASLKHGLPLEYLGENEQSQRSDVDGCRGKNFGRAVSEATPTAVSDADLTPEQREEAAIVAKRAEILARHRQESNAVRSLMYEAIRNKEGGLSKLGKMCADTLQIIQNLERKAWGLDKAEPAPRDVIVIDRG